MKFGQFMSCHWKKTIAKKFCKNCDLKTTSKPFYVCKELIKYNQLMENEIFEPSYLDM